MAQVVERSEKYKAWPTNGGWSDYFNGFTSQLFDGKPWTGSFYDLCNIQALSYNSDENKQKWFVYHYSLYQSVPKVIFDYGTYCGHPEFEYIYVPVSDWYHCTWDIYALTNNKTVLQYVGQLYYYNNGDNVSVNTSQDPNENYNNN